MYEDPEALSHLFYVIETALHLQLTQPANQIASPLSSRMRLNPLSAAFAQSTGTLQQGTLVIVGGCTHIIGPNPLFLLPFKNVSFLSTSSEKLVFRYCTLSGSCSRKPTLHLVAVHEPLGPEEYKITHATTK